VRKRSRIDDDDDDVSKLSTVHPFARLPLLIVDAAGVRAH
jgi:hypothetical protein